jgi:cobalamin synthase
LLFLSSYSPLFALLAWRYREEAALWMPLAGVAVVSAVALLALVFIPRDIKGGSLKLETIQPRDAEVLAYVVTYLLPFLALDLERGEDLLAFLVFLAILAIISVTSHALFVNPLLSLLGFRTYDVTDRNDRVYFLCTRERLGQHPVVQPLFIDDYVRFEPWRPRKKISST